MSVELDEPSVIEWINSFEFAASSPIKSLSELQNGFILFKMLREIAPDDFRESMLQKGSGSEVDVQNVNRILNKLYYFFGERYDFSHLSASRICKGVPEDTEKILEFIILAMIDCEQQDQFIGRIMEIGEQAQYSMQHMIQKVMQLQPTYGHAPPAPHEVGGDLGSVTPNEKVATRLARRMRSQELLRSQSGEAGEAVGAPGRDDGGSRGREYKAMYDEVMGEKEVLQERVQAMEKELLAAKEDMKKNRNNAESTYRDAQREESDRRQVLVTQITDLESQIEALKRRLKDQEHEHKEDMRRLQDDFDLSKSRIVELQADCAKLQKYKAKLEAMADMKGHTKELEEKMQEYVDKIVKLEEENRTIATQKKLVDQYKKKVADQEGELASLKIEMESSAQHLAEIEKMLKTADSKLDLKDSELEAVKAELEVKKQIICDSQEKDVDLSTAATDTLAMREKVMRLEKENASLKGSMTGDVSSAAERIAELENELDDERRVRDRLEKNFQATSARAHVLQRQMEHGGGGEEISAQARVELETLRQTALDYAQLKQEHEQRTKQLNDMYQAKDALQKQLLDEKDRLVTTQTKNAALEAECRLKDEETKRLQIARDEALKSGAGANESDRLKMLQLQKENDELVLKNKLDTLTTQLQVAESKLEEQVGRQKLSEEALKGNLQRQYDTVMNTLKQQLQIREREITFYKNSREIQKDDQRKEERLMASAFYELGLRYQQLLAHSVELEEKLSSGSPTSRSKSAKSPRARMPEVPEEES